MSLAGLCQEWYGAKSEVAPRFRLRLCDDYIIFSVHVENKIPVACPHDTSGAFLERLWEADCAELFLCNSSNGFYLEFNLSPLGSWWSCAFTSPFVQSDKEPTAIAGITTTASMSLSSEMNCAEDSRGMDGWTAEMAIPTASLPPRLHFDANTTTGNVTFCLRDKDSFQNTYISFYDLSADGSTPNFHQPHLWKPLFVI